MLRVGFDLDGVLADMEAELARQAEKLFGETITSRVEGRAEDVGCAPASDAAPARDETAEAFPASVSPLLTLNLTPRQQRRLWNHIGSIENFWQTLEPLEPGVIERLWTIAAARRWEVIFFTKRPETVGSTAQVQSQQWLESQGFTLPSVYVVQGSRGRIAAALDLDIVVDDRPENCLDVVVDSKARAILVWREDEQRLPATARRLGIAVVKSVAESLDVLAQLDSNAREQPGVIDRVLRRLGLKEPASA